MLWVSPIDCWLFDCLLPCCSTFGCPILLCQFIAEFLAWILMVESPCCRRKNPPVSGFNPPVSDAFFMGFFLLLWRFNPPKFDGSHWNWFTHDGSHLKFDASIPLVHLDLDNIRPAVPQTQLSEALGGLGRQVLESVSRKGWDPSNKLGLSSCNIYGIITQIYLFMG